MNGILLSFIFFLFYFISTFIQATFSVTFVFFSRSFAVNPPAKLNEGDASPKSKPKCNQGDNLSQINIDWFTYLTCEWNIGHIMDMKGFLKSIQFQNICN